MRRATGTTNAKPRLFPSLGPKAGADASSPSSPRLTVGVMGGGTGVRPEYLERGRELGRAIARHSCVLITGACHGIPHAAAQGAHEQGALVVGISPGLNHAEHTKKYESPLEDHDVIIFTGAGTMGREVLNIRSSDMVIIAGGRTGTLGELVIAYEEGKIIGVLTHTGGITVLVKDIMRVCEKNDSNARLLYDEDPARLVQRMVVLYYNLYPERWHRWIRRKTPDRLEQRATGS